MNIFKISCVIIATLIGAGFATGQEIMQFFNRFSIQGIYGILLMGISMITITMVTLEIIRTKSINNLNEFINEVVPIKVLQNILKKFNTIVLFCFFVVMIAGAGAFFEEYFGLKIFLGSGIILFACYIVFNKDTNSVIMISDILVPFIIIGIIIIGLSTLNFGHSNIYRATFNTSILNNNGWAMSSILYTAYNMVSVIAILTTLKRFINSKKVVIFTSIISGIISIILELLIFFVIGSNYTLVSSSEIPILTIITQAGISLGGIYNLILIFSIFTTAINIGYSFLLKTSKTKEEYKKMTLYICFMALLLGSFGFSTLVRIIYPLIGIVGILEIILIIYRFIRIKT